MQFSNEPILEKLESYFGDWFNTNEYPQMKKNLYPYTSLFSSIEINNCLIKNRVVMGPMSNVNMVDSNGSPTTKMIKYFGERAKGGVGLVTTGFVPVAINIDPTITGKKGDCCFPQINKTNSNICGWRNLAYEVHNYGAKLFVQLSAGFGRVGDPSCLFTKLKFPVAASWNTNYYASKLPCKRLSNISIKRIIKKVAEAAETAKYAGIDGVYIHGHEGHLVEQLSNCAFNHRKLGRYSNYMQFGIDMIEKIREHCGKDYPIMYRIDLSLALNSTYGDKLNKVKELKKFKDERSIEDTLAYMKKLVEAGVDAFDIDIGCYENWWLPHPPSTMPSGCYVDIAAMVKKYFEENNILSNVGKPIVIIATGKLGYPDLSEEVIKDNKADMVMLSRPLLADPEWVSKAYKGQTEDITPCIGCHSCLKEITHGGYIQCAVCPKTGHEDENNKVQKQQKKIAVVGAGPAGVVAAETLIKNGHTVDLYEKSSSVGGTLKLAGIAKNKYEIRNYIQYLQKIVENIKQNTNFNAYFCKNITNNELKQLNYDAIIYATGSKSEQLNIDGAVLPHVHTIKEVLNNLSIFEKARSVAIIGGGESGCELAYMLAYEQKKKVTIIENSPYLMKHACNANRGHILHYLEKAGVKAYNCAIVQKIEEGYVDILANIHSSVPNLYNTWSPLRGAAKFLTKRIKEKYKAFAIDADVVVLATGVISDDKMFKDAYKNQIAPEIYVVGDANKSGKVFTAVKQAYNLAKNI